MCVVAWHALVDGLYRLYRAGNASLDGSDVFDESVVSGVVDSSISCSTRNNIEELPSADTALSSELLDWTKQSSFFNFVKKIAHSIPAIAEAMPFIFVLGPCVQGLYISIRSGWVDLTRGITSIIGPMFPVVGKHNYDKLCHQMNAFWQAMTPLQQFAIGCTYTVHTSKNSLHNQAGDETLESTLNKLVACTKGSSEEIRNK